MGLNERQFLILQAIIDDYISTAVPVGSRTISRKSGVGFSPATIRNEMSDLEELGYLDQPHTSAGRVPSVKAYRLYVDQLMKSAQLTNDEREQMHEHIGSTSKRAESIIRSAAQTLADATRYTAVVLAPKINTLRIRHIQLVPVAPQSALMIIVTNVGIVKDAAIRVPEELDDADALYAVSRMLTRRLEGKPIEAVRQTFALMFREAEFNRSLLRETLSVLERKLQSDDTPDFAVAGVANLMNYPEFSEVEKAKALLNVMEAPDVIRRLFDPEQGNAVSIRIGPENGVPALNDCSVVTARYNVANDVSGTLGVIGPTRMNYNRVISVLDFVGAALSEVLSYKQAQ